MEDTHALQEVLLVIHFAPAVPLTILDLADWCARVKGGYPIAQQQPPWDPFQWNQPGGIPIFGFGPTLPRLMAMTADQRRTVHLQSDRFVFTWRRLEPTGQLTPYPGFEEVAREARVAQDEFREWWRRRFGGDVGTTAVELNYLNAIPAQIGEKSLRLSEVFRFVSPEPKRPVAGFNASWLEMLAPPHVGRVQCSIGVTSLPDCPHALFFNFMGAGPIATSTASPQPIEELYLALHDGTRTAFAAAINRVPFGG